MKFPENAGPVSNTGADLLGYIFYPKSKRYVGDQNGYIPEKLFQPKLPAVGVFVNESLHNIIEYANNFNLSYIQLHGNESPGFCNEVKKSGLKVIKAFGINEGFDFSLLEAYYKATGYFLFDTKTICHGGSGKKFDWGKLMEYKGGVPFFLSGGIKPDDAAAIKKISHHRMAGIDLNSGFENSPGLKNIKQLKYFINEFK